jgi:vacuolar-type H+-ATPase subunit I/STV1
MAIDQVPEQEVLPMDSPEGSGHAGKFVLIFLILAGLAVGEIITLNRLSKLSSLTSTLQAQQEQARKDISAQLQERLSSSISEIQRSNAQQLEGMKAEVAGATQRMGTTNAQLRKTKTMLSKLKQDQQVQAQQLKEEISQKADAQQVGTLTQDVSATRTDLDTTKKAVDSLRSDLGMARSELGTLIARNHDDIETLRKLGERDYFEFTLDRKHPQRIANVGLELTKTNPKRHRYNMNLTVDDLQVERRDRAINEPIFFYVGGSKKPYEVVVNGVQSNAVKGYLSTPKGATEVAERSEGTR